MVTVIIFIYRKESELEEVSSLKVILLGLSPGCLTPESLNLTIMLLCWELLGPEDL
jgi:hypothetical protein